MPDVGEVCESPDSGPPTLRREGLPRPEGCRATLAATRIPLNFSRGFGYNRLVERHGIAEPGLDPDIRDGSFWELRTYGESTAARVSPPSDRRTQAQWDRRGPHAPLALAPADPRLRA